MFMNSSSDTIGIPNASAFLRFSPAARKALGIPDDRTMESLQKELQAAAEAAAAQ